jgi:hypothetical protein
MRDNHVSSTTPEEKNVAVVERKDRVARCYLAERRGGKVRVSFLVIEILPTQRRHRQEGEGREE